MRRCLMCRIEMGYEGLLCDDCAEVYDMPPSKTAHRIEQVDGAALRDVGRIQRKRVRFYDELGHHTLP